MQKQTLTFGSDFRVGFARPDLVLATTHWDFLLAQPCPNLELSLARPAHRRRNCGRGPEAESAAFLVTASFIGVRQMGDVPTRTRRSSLLAAESRHQCEV